jgi:acetolactate synthase-1/2/3 large subunit
MLKDTLFNCDTNEIVKIISSILECIDDYSTITSDVGNNEFWLSRAYAFSKSQHRMLFSKSFGALGCSIPKAIGVSVSNGNKVLCFTGDQGIQINMQELMVISTNNLPIMIVVLNNQASGMIRDREKNRYNKLIHTTKESGYQALNLEKIANAYGLTYYQWDDSYNSLRKVPCIIEVRVCDGELIPFLPKGNPIQKLSPNLTETLYQQLDRS